MPSSPRGNRNVGSSLDHHQAGNCIPFHRRQIQMPRSYHGQQNYSLKPPSLAFVHYPLDMILRMSRGRTDHGLGSKT